MIYITGDCHFDFRRFNTKNFPEQKEMTKDNYVIICGDFGGVWHKDIESAEEKHHLDWLNDKPFTTLFVDGNHENFDRLYSYPVEKWNGGKVHKIRDSIIHLMRGQIFNIDGRSFLTFGGARSHDIDGGILNLNDPDFFRKKRELDLSWIPYRIDHLSWWKEEEPSELEMKEGLCNLEANNWKVDFVVSHDCPTSDLFLLYAGLGKVDSYDLTNYLEDIRCKLNYKRWFFGHHHDNKAVNDRDIMIYEQIIRIN